MSIITHSLTLTRSLQPTFAPKHSVHLCILLNTVGKHMLSRIHTHTQTWEVCRAARLWALWGHMMVGGRFERAYLRIDRAADCSCAEMIYMGRKAHTFWSLYPQTCAWECETQVHVIAGEFHMTWILDCKTNLHICMWQSLSDVSRLLTLFSHSLHKKRSTRRL